MANTGNSPIRLAGLDLLRGSAVLMVLFVHAPVPAAWTSDAAPHWLRVFMRMRALGGYGVDLFFVLSGFLVAGLLIREHRVHGRIRIQRFLLRRGLKIWPSYYVAYGAAAALSLIPFVRRQQWAEAWHHFAPQWVNLTFFQNYLLPEHRWFASWSLAVEEHFYLLLPLQVLIARGRWIPHFSAAFFLLSPIFRWLLNTDGDYELAYIQTHARADSLYMGVLLAWIKEHQPERFRWLRDRWTWAMPSLVAATACAVVWPPADHPVSASVIHTLLFIGFAALVLHASALQELGRLSSSMAAVGRYSYTIYLAQPVLAAATTRVLVQFMPLNTPLFDALSWIIFFAGSLLVGVTLSRMVEQPVLVWRDRHLPGRAPSTTPDASR